MNISFTRIDEIELNIPTVSYEITVNNKTYECVYKVDSLLFKNKYEGEDEISDFYYMAELYGKIGRDDIFALRVHETICGQYVVVNDRNVIIESLNIRYVRNIYQRISVLVETIFGSKVHEMITFSRITGVK